jgi:hypothetical protein
MFCPSVRIVPRYGFGSDPIPALGDGKRFSKTTWLDDAESNVKRNKRTRVDLDSRNDKSKISPALQSALTRVELIEHCEGHRRFMEGLDGFPTGRLRRSGFHRIIALAMSKHLWGD